MDRLLKSLERLRAVISEMITRFPLKSLNPGNTDKTPVACRSLSVPRTRAARPASERNNQEKTRYGITLSQLEIALHNYLDFIRIIPTVSDN